MKRRRDRTGVVGWVVALAACGGDSPAESVTVSDSAGVTIFADSLPYFRSFLLDDAGRTWVQRDPGYGHPALEWDVFGEAGTFLGSVLLPGDFTPHDVRGDRMVGVWTDALDVEHVEVRRIALPASPENPA